MRNTTYLGVFMLLCAITTNGLAQETCDCVHWPWESGCTDSCRGDVEPQLGSYTYMEPGEFPRSNYMASDATELIYGPMFPRTEYGFPVLSATLYNDPENFGWTDVSTLSSKEGAIAVWPTMSGLVVEDDTEDPAAGQGNVRVLYPSHRRGGELTISDARWLGEGAEPKFLVPTVALRDSILDLFEPDSIQ